MTILLPALAIAFTAFGVWLTVRIVNRRERWAKWTGASVVVLALIGYPLSIGPMFWLFEHEMLPEWAQDTPIYEPLGWIDRNVPPFNSALHWYLSLWTDIETSK